MSEKQNTSSQEGHRGNTEEEYELMTKILGLHYHFPMGRDSVVGIETRYGLDSPGIKSRWG